MPSLGSGSGHVVRHIPLWTEAFNTAVKRKKKIIVVIIHVEKGLSFSLALGCQPELT